MSNQRLGEVCFNKLDKINAELFALTYGAFVAQLLKDYEDVEQVNKELDKMGYNIGVRLIDEFLAKSGVSRCGNFKETVDVITKVGFKMFLGITPEANSWNAEGNSCALILKGNPLEEFVELPSAASGLHYSNIICGVLRGALEATSMKVKCSFTKDSLHGDNCTEVRLTLVDIIEDAAGDEYHED